MANFLITTASTLAQGTLTADTFYFNTARGVSIQGNGGNDVLTAGTANLTATNALLAGNAGNDAINLGSAFNTNQGSIFGGAGNDTFSASVYSAVDTTMQGGGGNDSVTFAGAVLSRGNLGLNAGDDSVVVSAGGMNAASAVIALGGGSDTFTATAYQAVGATLNGGGGADTINLDSASILNGGQVNGDVLGDDTFFGNDTITFGTNASGNNGASLSIFGGATINGGLGNDQISAGVGTGGIGTAFINGNQGNDVIVVEGIGSAAVSAFIGGGAGNDSITVAQDSDSGVSFGTIMGGGGVDTIIFSADLVNGLTQNNLGTTGGFIQGGEGADLISFNGTETGGMATVLYASAGESNIVGNVNSIDIVSSNAVSGNTDTLVFNVGQIRTAETLVSAQGTIGGVEVFSATSNGSGTFAGNVSGGIGGIVTFTSTFSDNIGDQVSALDVNTQQNGGAVALFSKGTDATRYLFMQGGTAGTADDLVVKVNEGVNSGSFAAVDIAAGSAISLDIG
jgi:hypothetical protein